MSVFTNPGTASREHANEYIAAVLEILGDEAPLGVLSSTPAAFAQAVAGLTPEQLRAPEKGGKWSIQQVLAHMADSEIVWSWRLRMVLAQDRPPLAGYDQDTWAERLGYGETDPAQSLRGFAALRQGNIGLLRRATPAELRRCGVHEERGEETVEHMIRLYAGHDIIHTRQLERVKTVVTSSPRQGAQ